ncbi:hypothetical protein BHE90_003710 [Fusarium euwallaceae]|uniref:Amine oxidase n=1 Tax=Fusarium euwallaceae TaxID=1147111 RepID=A0A430M1E1_9HYPO|nr:hypothetical protein BHE90_003710 [Fusarium euwallaceae]
MESWMWQLERSQLGRLTEIMSGSLPHPFDPLTAGEIELTAAVVGRAHGNVHFHVITAQEPRKAEMMAWLANPSHYSRPRRIAEVVVVVPRGKVFDGLVDLQSSHITKWEEVYGEQPILIVEELLGLEKACRKNAKVIEQCVLSGISKDEMHKVYADPWTISHDTRFGSGKRVHQALMYFRPNVDDCQYQYPLDFCPIYDPETQDIIAIDIPKIRRPLQRNKAINYHHLAVQEQGDYRNNLRPINIVQPEGVSFSVTGREVNWQNWTFHVGFNYREGIVINNITFKDKENVRPVFYRMSLAEMVVPYGNPEPPHHRKHAFDLGEYGAGYLSNSLALGCDCKGAIYYMDAYMPTQVGTARKIKNAICIHEEDDGILFKHTDFRDSSTIVTRARKLIVQHIFTAANYEYAVQWVFHQDGTIQPDIKLTGILNTYVLNPGEDTLGYGTQVHKGVNAHNHQHIFCLRINPCVDGPKNTVHMVDAVPSEAPVGSRDNLYGNAFYAKRTRFTTTGEAATDYNGDTSRTWDIVNENRLNEHSGKPVSYKLVSRDVPRLMPKEGSLVWKRAAFARHAVHVTKYADDQLWPAGNHVAQSSGEPSRGLSEWIGDGTESIENTDIVLWHTFGITHFPSPEDFPVMPAEPITLLLRPRHFFSSNPVMDVPPSYSITPSEVASGKGSFDATDRVRRGTTDNYAYLVVDQQSKNAVIIDPANPLEVMVVLNDAIQKEGVTLIAILNTHHHWDHAGGNADLIAGLEKLELDVLGGEQCPRVTRILGHGDSFNLGATTVTSIHTPCHTQDSFCFFMETGRQRAVFTGDTLFVGGCGRFFEGSAAEMHASLNERLAALPQDTLIYPGHEYTRMNAEFAISVSQTEAIKRLHRYVDSNPITTGIFTIGDEKRHNVFMRVGEPEIQEAAGATDPVQAMHRLRQMKDSFKSYVQAKM